jgi:hypothetical protein
MREEGFRIDLQRPAAAIDEDNEGHPPRPPQQPDVELSVRRDEAEALRGDRAPRSRLQIIADEVFGDYRSPASPAIASLPSWSGLGGARSHLRAQRLLEGRGCPSLGSGGSVFRPDDVAHEALHRPRSSPTRTSRWASPVQRLRRPEIPRRGPIQAKIRARTAKNLATLDLAPPRSLEPRPRCAGCPWRAAGTRS